MKILARPILVCLSLIAITAVFTGRGYAVENLIKGGDFEEDADLQHWGIGLRDGEATMKRDESTAAVGRSSLLFEITKISPINKINPDLYNKTNDGSALEKGKTYTWSAYLKAESDRDVILYAQLEKAPWTSYLSETVTVGKEWKEYWGTFELEENAEPVRVWFLNTGSDIDFWVDGARLYEGEYVPTEPEEAALTIVGKIPTTWAMIKAKY